MAVAHHVPVHEYLASAFEFPAEYLDGQLLPKPKPKWFHSRIQLWLGVLLLQRFPAYAFGSEQICRLSDSEFRLPDIAVALVSEAGQNTTATSPLFLAIEILSPDDSLGKTFAKLERYHAWGTPFCWLIDPDRRACWTYHKGETPIQVQHSIAAGDIHLPVAEIFSIL